MGFLEDIWVLARCVDKSSVGFRITSSLLGRRRLVLVFPFLAYTLVVDFGWDSGIAMALVWGIFLDIGISWG